MVARGGQCVGKMEVKGYKLSYNSPSDVMYTMETIISNTVAYI